MADDNQNKQQSDETPSDPSLANAPAEFGVQGRPAKEENNITLYSQPPMMPRRTFLVQTFSGATDGFTEIEKVEGHAAHPAEGGTLVVSTIVGGTAWTTRVFAPGQWRGVTAEPPTRKQLENFARGLDAFYIEKSNLEKRVAQANAMTSLSGGTSPVSGGGSVASGRQLFGKSIN